MPGMNYEGEPEKPTKKKSLRVKRRELTKLWAEMVKDGRPLRELDAVQKRIKALSDGDR